MSLLAKNTKSVQQDNLTEHNAVKEGLGPGEKTWRETNLEISDFSQLKEIF